MGPFFRMMDVGEGWRKLKKKYGGVQSLASYRWILVRGEGGDWSMGGVSDNGSRLKGNKRCQIRKGEEERNVKTEGMI